MTTLFAATLLLSATMFLISELLTTKCEATKLTESKIVFVYEA